MGFKHQKTITKPKIDRPIFIVGCGRSGSTLLYNIMCTHPDLSWFSTFTNRYPSLTSLAFLSRFFFLRQGKELSGLISKAIPKPSEGYRIWDWIRPVENSPSDPGLTEKDTRTEEVQRCKTSISHHQQYHGRDRFINKNTRNTRRIGYLNSMFPDALFIHIIRDPRASVASLLKTNWWPTLKLWNHDLVTPEEWSAEGKDSVVLASHLWRDETQIILDYQRAISNRYHRVLYEELITKPLEIIQKILTFCDLSWNNEFSEIKTTFNLKNMNYKFGSELTPEQQEKIKKITGPTLEEIGVPTTDE